MNPEESPKIHVTFVYSRKQALADGFQVDVSELAREAGFKFPVFITRAVYDRYVAVTPGVEGQDEIGRLWDILTMLHFAIRRSPDVSVRMQFTLLVRNDNVAPRPVQLEAECGPVDFDDAKPAFTIMVPGED